MSEKLQYILIIIATIVISAGAITYGALTAPQPKKSQQSVASKSLPKAELDARLQQELPTILAVLNASNPKIATDYQINQGKLYDQGQWFGTTLSYKGSDNLNRDTLRVLLQKKDGAWILRTTPPVPLLSTKAFPDTPKSVLKAINQPISLP